MKRFPPIPDLEQIPESYALRLFLMLDSLLRKADMETAGQLHPVFRRAEDLLEEIRNEVAYGQKPERKRAA